MKRIFALFMILPFMFISLYANPEKLVDNAGLLDSDSYAYIEAELNAERDFDIVIVTENSLGGVSPREYADDYYDSNGYSADGALLLVCMGSHEWYLSTAGDCIGCIFRDDVENYVVSYLSRGEYLKAFEMFVQLCDARMAGDNTYDYDASGNDEYISHNDTYYKQRSFEWLKTALISLVLGFIIALIAVTVMKGKLKTVHFQRGALNYSGDLQLTLQRDTFLYRQVTRVRLPENNNNTQSHGGGVHMSSGGVSHGGGGGKF